MRKAGMMRREQQVNSEGILYMCTVDQAFGNVGVDLYNNRVTGYVDILQSASQIPP